MPVIEMNGKIVKFPYTKAGKQKAAKYKEMMKSKKKVMGKMMEKGMRKSSMYC